jgi:hypothetical protein
LLDLTSAAARRREPIDLGLRRGYRFTVERGQTPDERIDKRVEVVIVQRAVHPAIAFGDISIEIVAAEDDLKYARTADQAREPFQRSAPGEPVRRRSRGCRIGRFAGWRNACRRPARTHYRCPACGRVSWRCSRLAWTRGAEQSRAKGLSTSGRSAALDASRWAMKKSGFADWRSSMSACRCVLKECLTPPTLLEMGIIDSY